MSDLRTMSLGTLLGLGTETRHIRVTGQGEIAEIHSRHPQLTHQFILLGIDALRLGIEPLVEISTRRIRVGVLHLLCTDTRRDGRNHLRGGNSALDDLNMVDIDPVT